MFDWFKKKEVKETKQCQHVYVEVAAYIDNPEDGRNIWVYFYECERCGHRKYDLSNESHFKSWYIERVKMWENNEYNLTEGDVTRGLSAYLNPTILLLEKCYKKEAVEKD